MSGIRSRVLTRVACTFLFLAVAALLGAAFVPYPYADTAVEYAPYVVLGLLVAAGVLGVLAIPRRRPAGPAAPDDEAATVAATATAGRVEPPVSLPIVMQRAQPEAVAAATATLPAPRSGHLPIGAAGNAGPTLPAGPARNDRRPVPHRRRAELPAGPVA